MYAFPEPASPGISRTALTICAWCAYVQRHPELRRAYPDPFAEGFFRAFAKNGDAIMNDLPDWNAVAQNMIGPQGTTYRAITHVTWRKHWIEDKARQAVQNGAKQLVIFGAGLDTLSLRLGMRDLSIFEIDQENLILAKEAEQEKRFGLFPNQRFLPFKAGETHPADLLAEAGFDPKLPTLFVAECVLEYLPHEAVEQIFTLVRNAPESSQLLFTFLSERSMRTEDIAKKWDEAASKRGEPVRFTLYPERLRDFMAGQGLRFVSSLNERIVRDSYAEELGIEDLDVLEGRVSPFINFILAENRDPALANAARAAKFARQAYR